jgi:streptogramin lyase
MRKLILIFILISREVQRLRRRVTSVLIGILVAATLSGCNLSSPLQSSSQPGVKIQGKVRGGQQPVSGASIQLYAAGSTGPGTGAIGLLTSGSVSTDASGSFNITGDYVCPTATTQVYLVASGGNPGLASGVSNPALVLMAALGNCGALTSSTSVQINEVTTVASAWALAQFMRAGAIVGSSATNATGLSNAFAVVNNLVDIGAGVAPGAALPYGAVTESAKLYALANALSVCVNSDGGSACTPLFAAATESGFVPTNTLDAALNIVQNPGNDVAAVFDIAAARGPFQPVLSSPPNDWTMTITHGGCVSGCGGLSLPGSLAINSAGNVLVANYFGAVLSEFSPTGVPASPNGLPGRGLRESYGIAIDGHDNVWVTNEQSVTAANNSHYGSVSEFSLAGVELSGYGYIGGGIYYPLAAATDSTGAIWIADYGNSSATLLADNGSAVSGNSGYATSELPFTSSVAIDANHNAWFTVQGGVVSVTPTGAFSSFPCCGDPDGVAIDQTGDIWVADYRSSSVIELASNGSVEHRTTLLGGNGGPQGIAVDGAGNIWTANYLGNTLVELAGSTATVVSPAQGYGLDAPIDEPYGLAIDASGNLWLSNAGANSLMQYTITQIVGLASPIRTPLLGPPVQP